MRKLGQCTCRGDVNPYLPKLVLSRIHPKIDQFPDSLIKGIRSVGSLNPSDPDLLYK